MILIFFYFCGVVREKTFCKAIVILFFFNFVNLSLRFFVIEELKEEEREVIKIEKEKNIFCFSLAKKIIS